jgi:hypothetical protein
MVKKRHIGVWQPDETWLWWISVQPDAEIEQWDIALRSVV